MCGFAVCSASAGHPIAAPRSYGLGGASYRAGKAVASHSWRRSWLSSWAAQPPIHVPASNRPVRIVALGDLLDRRLRVAGASGISGKARNARSRPRGMRSRSSTPACPAIPLRGGLARLDWSVPEGTDAVIVELGANDMLLGVHPAVTRNALAEIIRRLRDRNILILLAGMRAALISACAYVGEFERHIFRSRSAERRAFLPFLPRRVAAKARFNLSGWRFIATSAGIDAIARPHPARCGRAYRARAGEGAI